MLDFSHVLYSNGLQNVTKRQYLVLRIWPLTFHHDTYLSNPRSKNSFKYVGSEIICRAKCRQSVEQK